MAGSSLEESGWVAFRDSVTGRLVLARQEGESWEVSDGFVIRSMGDEIFRARYERHDF